VSKREQGAAAKRQLILDHLAGGTVADIYKVAMVLNLVHRSARKHVQRLRDEGLVRIDRWFDIEGAVAGRAEYPRPYYGLGSAPDAPQPGEVSKKEASRKRRARLKRDPMAKDIYLARRRATDKRKRRVSADPLVAALFGGAR